MSILKILIINVLNTYKMTSSSIITIDGLIGAGKSTIMKHIFDKHKINIQLEPIESWKPYLERIYKYNDSYYEFQLKIWKDVCCYENPYGKDVIMERSPFFIRKTFIKYLYDKKKIDEKQYENLLHMHEQSDTIWKPKTMIYLKISPEQALYRIKQRNRENENYINLSYLYELYELHEKAFFEAKELGYNVHVIDSNQNIDNIMDEILKLI